MDYGVSARVVMSAGAVGCLGVVAATLPFAMALGGMVAVAAFDFMLPRAYLPMLAEMLSAG